MAKRYIVVPSNEKIASALVPFGVGLSDEQLTNIAKYVSKLLSWNQSVSITSLDDPMEIVARHFGESIFAASVIALDHGRLADVGAGGGFPGVALKIARPQLDLLLIESNLKKCAFLADVKTSLGLPDVEIVRSRYEDLALPDRSVDFVCARALGDYRRLLRWAVSVMKPNGRVILWLGADDSLLVSGTEVWLWDLPVKIPESQRRVLLIGRLCSPSI